MTPEGRARITTVTFDLGGVLIDWDPRYLYRTLFDDEADMEAFLAEVTTPAWNAEQDAGRPWVDAVDALAAEYPEHRPLIEAYHQRWPETLGDAIQGTVEVLADLRDAGVRLLALSNWSAETFPVALERYPFLGWFEGIVISGEVGAAKPDERIFHVLIERHGIEPAETVFVDDTVANVEAAEELGFIGLRFHDPDRLRTDLVRLGAARAGRWPRSRDLREGADGLDRREHPAPGGDDRLHRRAAVPSRTHLGHRRWRHLQHQPDGARGPYRDPRRRAHPLRRGR